MKADGYAWITLALFLLTVTGHWIFGWLAYADEQHLHGAPVVVADYLVEMGRDTLENWQSEFLQLLWQVGGLALFLYVGRSQKRVTTEKRRSSMLSFVGSILRAQNR